MAGKRKAYTHEFRNDLTAEYLRSILHYEPRIGEFRWKLRNDVSGKGRRKTNLSAGFIRKDGYRQIKINDVSYLAHRLVWLYVHGCWPSHEIDHKRGDRSDNRIRQLREATDQQTAMNAGKRKKSIHHLKGITRQRNGRWAARIRYKKKITHLGTFDTPLQAHKVYRKAAKRLFGEFARFE